MLIFEKHGMNQIIRYHYKSFVINVFVIIFYKHFIIIFIIRIEKESLKIAITNRAFEFVHISIQFQLAMIFNNTLSLKFPFTDQGIIHLEYCICVYVGVEDIFLID